MLTFLFRVALLLVLLYLAPVVLKKFFGVRLVTRARPDAQPREIRGTMRKDPACGTYVDVAAALQASRDGRVFYFCSEDCRRKFLGLQTGPM